MTQDINTTVIKAVSLSLAQVSRALSDISTLLSQSADFVPVPTAKPTAKSTAKPVPTAKSVPKPDPIVVVEETKPAKPTAKTTTVKKSKSVVKKIGPVVEETKPVVVEETKPETITAPITEAGVTESLIKIMNLGKKHKKGREIHTRIKDLMVTEYSSDRIKDMDKRDYKNFLNDVCEIAKDMDLM